MAKKTETVSFSGTLSPTADVAVNGVIQSAILTTDEFEINELDGNGHWITPATLLSHVQIRDGEDFTNLFGPGPGTLSFTTQKGSWTLETKSLAVDGTTNVQDLVTFITEASGIDASVSGTGSSGVVEGAIRIISNNGIENYVRISPSSFAYTSTGAGFAQTLRIPFSEIQAPVGEGTVTGFVVYDSFGTPFTVRLSTAVESKSGNDTTYRWFATSADNQPSTGVGTTIGTGTFTFDGQGDLVPGGNRTIAIQRSLAASHSPLEIQLDLSNVTSLEQSGGGSILNFTSQNGYPLSTLHNYAITSTGEIRGVFSSGLERVLGQVPLATIPDPFALRQVADGLFAQTTAAGEPSISNPRTVGHGSLTPLPPDYFVAEDGYLTNDTNYTPTASSLASGSPYSPRYPWILRSAHLEIDGKDFFAVEGRNGRTQYTRDGDFHLNRHQELVTRNGLRVLGYGVDDNFEIDSSRLVPLTAPLGSFTHKTTTKFDFRGSLSPPVELAAQPAIIESAMLNSDLSVDTKLVDVVMQSDLGTSSPFQIGVLTPFSWGWSSRVYTTLRPKTLLITSDTTVGDWMFFLEQSLGIDKSIGGQHDVGAEIVDGKIRITSYQNIDGLALFRLSRFTIWPPSSDLTYYRLSPYSSQVSFPLQQLQVFKMKRTVNEEGTSADFLIYDHNGLPAFINISTHFEARDADSATYRWVATSADNRPAYRVATVLGNGLLVFDNAGTLIHGAIGEIVFERPGSDSPPLTIQLDFSQVSGIPSLNRCGEPRNVLNYLHQDGFPPGWLKKFDITPEGEIQGTFTNRMVRPLGQIVLAKFPSPWGLRHSGREFSNRTSRAGQPEFAEPGTSGTGGLLSLPPDPPHHIHHHTSQHRRSQIRRTWELSDTLAETESWRTFKWLRELTPEALRRRR